MYAFVCMRMCICMRKITTHILDNCIYSTYACLCVLHVDVYVLYVICICMCVRVCVHFGTRRRMMRTVNCRIGRISTSGLHFIFRIDLRLRGRISSSRPNFVFAAEYRLQGRISSWRPNFVFRAEFRLRGRISSSGPSSGPNFVFRADFRLRGRISSSPCPKPNFVFTGISSSWPIFVFKFRLRAQFELQLLGNNFVFKSFGISASGGVRNRDPLSRVNAA